MSAGLVLGLAGWAAAMGAAAWGFYNWNKVDMLNRVLGKSFVNSVSSGRAGVIVAEIKEHVVEFKHYPTARLDPDGFYHIEVTDEEGEKTLGVRKIPAEDILFLNGKRPMAFVLHSKIRSFNINQIKTLDAASLADVLPELMHDYNYYMSLVETSKAIAAQMNLNFDPGKLAQLRAEQAQVQAQIKALEKKWGAILARLKAGEDVILTDGEEAYLFRPVNFSKFAEYTTGASPTQVSKMAREMHHKWASKVLEDLIRLFKVPSLSNKRGGVFGDSTMVLLIVAAVLGLAALVMLARGG